MKAMNFPRLLGVCLILGLLSACTGNSGNEATTQSDQMEAVSVSFGEKSLSGRGALTKATGEVQSMSIWAMENCSGVFKSMSYNQSPATVSTCKSAIDQIQLQSVVLKISSGGVSRLLSISLTSPLPAGLSLSRTVVGAAVVYQFVEKGGDIVSSYSLLNYFTNATVVVNYFDAHFLEAISYEASGSSLKAIFVDCPNCSVKTAESTFPAGMGVVGTAPGSITFNTAGLPNGSYPVSLKVTETSSSLDRLNVIFTISILNIEETLEENPLAPTSLPEATPVSSPSSTPSPSPGASGPTGSPGPLGPSGSDAQDPPENIKDEAIWENIQCNIDGTCTYKCLQDNGIYFKDMTYNFKNPHFNDAPEPEVTPLVVLAPIHDGGPYTGKILNADNYATALKEASDLGLKVLVLKLGWDAGCPACDSVSAQLASIKASTKEKDIAFLSLDTRRVSGVYQAFRNLPGKYAMGSTVPQTYFFYRDKDNKWRISSTVRNAPGTANLLAQIAAARAQ